MKKIVFTVFTVISSIFVMLNVNAKEVYYTNGVVNLTEKEYNYVLDFYGEEYLKNMTIENYKWLAELDVNNREVEIKHVKIPDISPNGTYVSTPAKSLGISKSCSTNYCTISALVIWFGDPTIHSWDVMGARFYGTGLYNQNVKTILNTVNGTVNASTSNYRFLTDGFGASFQIPTGDNLSIEQRFYVKPDGRVYVSYQHAKKNTTLAASKQYNLSIAGYGSVFSFYGDAYDVYDGMVGVNVNP